MSNKNHFALMSAMLLSGAVAFTACSSDDELAGDNTGSNPAAGEVVKTQFAINIPYGPKTRMSAENTQNNNNFLGMENVHLLSFANEPGNGGTAASAVIPLTDISGITADASSKIYNDVNVPLATKYFLFYATAPKGTDATSKFANGDINDDALLDGNTALSNINFKLQPVIGQDANGEANQLLGVINAVADVANWETGGTDVDEELRGLFTTFTSIKGGSANNIEAALQALYNTVERWATGAEGDNKTIAEAIRAAITANTYGTDGNTQVFTVAGSAAPYTISTTLTYPQNMNLPDGAVQLKYDNGAFAYEQTSGNTGLTGLDKEKICYPASLYYFVNTNLAASASDVETWPSTTNNWVTSAPWVTNKKSWGSEVTATTRSIALKKNIQYAVANLKLTVKCGNTQLKDNGTTENPAVWVPVPADGIPVTAVLIGGQPASADWKFEPAASTAMDMTVYDKTVSDMVAKANTASDPNYTLVLSDTLANAQKVNFAIELTNNTGVEFRGVDGVIPAGGTFYLVGQLNPDGKTLQNFTEPHVFAADYQTTATVTINSLAKAYNTIPDLRATKMELGLSVDLSWNAGLSFDVTID